jgi:type IV secretion system protein VirB10
MMTMRTMAAMLVPAMMAMGQDTSAVAVPETLAPSEVAAPAPGPGEKTYPVPIGTRLLLSMVNSVSTKHSQAGDRVYLETTFPISINSRIVIPAGSYVMGTIMNTKRPGKVKGKGEFFLRFDSLMLPNGVTRDFRGTLSNLDGRAAEDLDKEEGVVRSEGNKSGDARVIGESAAWGASIGGLAGIGRAPGMGVGIGAAAGATAGLLGVLLTRGPDAVLAKGTTVEMVLDRVVTYSDGELDFSKAPPQFRGADGGGPLPSVKSQQRGRF